MAHYILSALKSFVATHHSEPFWVEIVVHKHSDHLTFLRSDTKTFTLVAPAYPEKLVENLRHLDIVVAGVVYEAGPTGFSLARTLQTEEFPIIVAAPSKVPRSITAGAKTDRLDCIKLSYIASKGLIRPIAIPTEQEEAHRAL